MKTAASQARGRPKSDADDYRYFPEPDLVPVQPSHELIESDSCKLYLRTQPTAASALAGGVGLSASSSSAMS